MDVLLMQVDGKEDFGNLALMKVSAYHKQQGDNVGFKVSNPDIVYISAIFSQNKEQTKGMPLMFPEQCTVKVGGSGVYVQKKLPDEIEHIMPDYSLYNLDRSMGFSSRGCIRNCPFCIVREKEGYIHEHAPIDEFLHPDHNKLVLMDNNFFASPRWREKIEYLIEWGGKINFCQGNDIRLIDKEKAQYLAELNYYNWHFSGRQLHFAWDFIETENQVERGVKNLLDAGIPPGHLMFYMLVGYNTTFKEDMHRYKRLWEDWGVYPYVMIYNYEGAAKWQGDPRIPHFARWVNARIHKSKDCQSFEEYEPVKPILEAIQ